jgi:hypothetical protein
MPHAFPYGIWGFESETEPNLTTDYVHVPSIIKGLPQEMEIIVGHLKMTHYGTLSVLYVCWWFSKFFAQIKILLFLSSLSSLKCNPLADRPINGQSAMFLDINP